MAIRVDGAGQQPQVPRRKRPADLAKALGITVEKLQSMLPNDDEKLAKEKGVNLKEYGRPTGPQSAPQGGPQGAPPLAFNGDAIKVDISGATFFG